MSRVLALLMAAFIAASGVAWTWFRFAESQAPPRSQMEIMMTSAIIKRDGFANEDKCLFPLFIDQSEMSLPFRTVLLGAEDRNFANHRFGISETGIAASIVSVFLGHSRGGSTIGQQLVKNVMFEPGDSELLNNSTLSAVRILVV